MVFACPYCPLCRGWICGFVGAQTSQATAARESTLCTLTRSHCPVGVGSKEGEDRRERRDIVGGRARFLWGEVDVFTEDGDKYILVPAAGFNGQLTS